MLQGLLSKKSLTEKMTVNWRATFTGKPLEIGGSLGREEATGMGGYYTLDNLMKIKEMMPGEVTLAVQGMGNVGYWFARLASEAGYKVVAISDSKGGIVSNQAAGDSDQSGLDIVDVMEYKTKNGSLQGYPGAKNITNNELLLLPVTVLVPAALENVITAEVAEKIQAKYIIEMANGPVTPEADAVLAKRGILSVPDVLANAGGVTVSYFEWVQNLHGAVWSKEQVFDKLREVMDRAFAEMWEAYGKLQANLRMAAYANAVSRVVEAMKYVN